MVLSVNSWWLRIITKLSHDCRRTQPGTFFLKNRFLLLASSTMNAIISLCHFCELHGPKILFCTQTLRPQEPGDADAEENGGTSAASRERVSSLSERLKSVSLAQGCGLATGEPSSTPPAKLASTPKDTTKDHAKVLCEVKIRTDQRSIATSLVPLLRLYIKKKKKKVLWFHCFQFLKPLICLCMFWFF